MRRLTNSFPPRLLLSLVGVSFVLAPAVAEGGTIAPGLRQYAAALRQRGASLAVEEHAALLELYSIETRLNRVQRRLGDLEQRAAALRQERQVTELRLAAARRTLAAAEAALASQLRVLYEQGDTNPFAVLLGATSLDEAVTGLDDLSRAANHSRQVIDQVATARQEIVGLTRTLQDRQSAVAELTGAARATEASLASAETERAAYISRLRRQSALNAERILALEGQARLLEARSEAVLSRESVSPSVASFAVAAVGLASPPPSAPPGLGVAGLEPGARTVTVASTGYSLPGSTATGMPVGWGVVAVDPAVIPLGTRLTIPGYGDGVAADIGPAVRGAAIDLWFPSDAQAHAWGRRLVTVILH